MIDPTTLPSVRGLTPDECLASARRIIATIDAEALEAIERLRSRIASAARVTRADTRSLNRVLSLARYAAHCARATTFRSGPPAHRRRAKAGFWTPEEP